MRDDLLPLFAANESDYGMLEEEEDEEDEGGGSWASCIMGVISKPWDVAFKVTIPACERDSFQEWEDGVEDRRLMFVELPTAVRDRVQGEEGALEATWVKGTTPSHPLLLSRSLCTLILVPYPRTPVGVEGIRPFSAALQAPHVDERDECDERRLPRRMCG